MTVTRKGQGHEREDSKNDRTAMKIQLLHHVVPFHRHTVLSPLSKEPIKKKPSEQCKGCP